MAISNAGQYGAAAVYYGASASPFTRWPTALGGDLNGVNAFMVGRSTYGVLGPRPVAAYGNASQSGAFALRVSGGGGQVPCRIGPVAAAIDTQGPYGGIY